MIENKEKIEKLKKLIEAKEFDYKGIYEFIPQRPPFLMLDKVLDINVDEKKVICQKCISSNEWYLAGHFPDRDSGCAGRRSARLSAGAVRPSSGRLSGKDLRR